MRITTSAVQTQLLVISHFPLLGVELTPCPFPFSPSDSEPTRIDDLTDPDHAIATTKLSPTRPRKGVKSAALSTHESADIL